MGERSNLNAFETLEENPGRQERKLNTAENQNPKDLPGLNGKLFLERDGGDKCYEHEG